MTAFEQFGFFIAMTCWLSAALFAHVFLASVISRLLARDLIPWQAIITKFSTEEATTPITNDILIATSPYDITYLTIEYTYTFDNNTYTNTVIDKMSWIWPYSCEKTIRTLASDKIKCLKKSYEEENEICIYVHSKIPKLSTIYKDDIRGNPLLFSPLFIFGFYFMGKFVLYM